MEHHEITLGQATYQIYRVYQETRSLSELLAERIQAQEVSSFDEPPQKKV